MSRFLLVSILLFSHAALPAMPDTVDVLLTNDDGYSSPGIKVLQSALSAAGYNVIVVAPLKQQSASGMKVSLHSLKVIEQGPRVWSVEGSPADSVLVALAGIYKSSPPKYVVSGPNFGQNLGSNVMLSGTVGAAVTAAMQGIPSISLSVGLDLGESERTPIKFPSTVVAFRHAAKLLVRVLQEIQQQPSFIPKGHVLNINYPLRMKKTGGANFAASRVSQAGGFKLNHSDIDTSTNISKVEVVIEELELHAKGVDARYFSEGHATFSLLKPDWNATSDSIKVLTELVSNLNKGR